MGAAAQRQARVISEVLAAAQNHFPLGEELTCNSLQDWPGRIKLWSVGVPPSGPMDARAFRFANALVGNAPDAAGLEFAVVGGSCLFTTCSA